MVSRKSALTQKRERVRMIVGGAATFVAVLLVVGIAIISRLPEVTIAAVSVDGARSVSESAVEEYVHSALRGSHFFLIPKKNALLYPKTEIEKELKEHFLPIKLVSAERDGFTRLVIALEEREPVAKWCDIAATTAPCIAMDSSGFLFIELQEEELPGTMVYHSAGLSLGDTFLSGEFPKLIAFLDSVQTAVQKTPHEVIVDEYDDIYVRFRDGGELRFVRGYEPQALLDNVASVFASTRFQNGEPFEYVDFRFGNKVYVKFRGD